MTKKIQLKGITEPEAKIWHYISIENFKLLLSSQTLYLNTIEHYTKIDPFEGFYPKKSIDIQIENYKKQAQKIPLKYRHDPEFLMRFIKHSSNISAIHCWHINDNESAPMWKLYHNSVAIQSTILNLFNALESQCHLHEHMAGIYPVKYFDFDNKQITKEDCVIDGDKAPFFKRAEFTQEQELRVLSWPINFNRHDPDNFFKIKPAAIELNIEPILLIENIVLAPNSTEALYDEVSLICSNFHLNDLTIKKSSLSNTPNWLSFKTT